MFAGSTIRHGATMVLILTSLVISTVTVRAQIVVPGGPLFTRDDYDYAPSVIQEGSVVHFWWCGGTGTADFIYYRSVDLNGPSWSDIVPVLTPTQGAWDGKYTCDPSVIRGAFVNPADSGTYSFAMYYTGTDDADGLNGRIGVAFSNNGVDWVKYPNPVIAPQGDASQLYGAGQPSTYNGDGQSGIWLFHFDNTTEAGRRVWVRYTSDGINFGSPTLLSNNGAPLSDNSDFAFDYSTGYFYAAIALPWPLVSGDRETTGFVFAKMPAADLLSGQGTWEVLAQVDTSVTGAYLNHSPGLLRDGYGNVTPFFPFIEAFFAWGPNEVPGWDLTWAAWQP